MLHGAIVFILDPPTKDWPDGDYGHMGIYVGNGYALVAPSGKPGDVVHASASMNGVYPSVLAVNAWTHVALHKGVAYPLAGFGGASGDSDTAVERPTATTPEATGTIYANVLAAVNMRKTPGGERHLTIPLAAHIPIFEQKTVSGKLYGRTEYANPNGMYGGWIEMQYVEVEGGVSAPAQEIAQNTAPPEPQATPQPVPDGERYFYVKISAFGGRKMDLDVAADVLEIVKAAGLEGELLEM